MADHTHPYRIHVHASVAAQKAALEAATQLDPTGREADALRALKDGVKALRDGREAEFGGKRFNPLVDRHGALDDVAEVKLPVDREVASNGYEFGPSHRMTYQEFEGTKEDSRPIRHVIAFEPRKDGQAFEVTARRLERAVGVPLPGLDAAKAAEARRGGGPPAPVRMPLDPALADAVRAASNPTPASRAAVKPTEPPVAKANTVATSERSNVRTQS